MAQNVGANGHAYQKTRLGANPSQPKLLKEIVMRRVISGTTAPVAIYGWIVNDRLEHSRIFGYIYNNGFIQDVIDLSNNGFARNIAWERIWKLARIPRINLNWILWRKAICAE